jgi:23S rRNA pseudouridine1911/1915/1917 synthase
MATQNRAVRNEGWTYFDRLGPDSAGIEVVEFYAQHYPHSTRDTWSERIAMGLVRLDGRRTSSETVVRAGQGLSYHRLPWHEPEAPTQFAVAHQDADLIAIIKPSGLPVLPGGQFLQRTLLHQVRHKLGAHLSPLHRLGRGTSGLVLFAASPRAKTNLCRAFRAGSVRKRYRTLVAGTDMPDTFSVEVPIGRVAYEPIGNLYAATETGAPARSNCGVRRRDLATQQTLLDVEIPTGRPHQIRIHLAAAGYPLVGDPLYGTGGVPLEPGPGEQFALPGDCGYHLHARYIGFTHPGSGRWLEICCRPPAPLRCDGE